MNILLTSVGRRAYMVKYFKEALGTDGLICVSNSSNLTPAFQYADKAVLSPLIYDETYIPFLLKFCKENKIDLLTSLFDIDLLVLARNKERFAAIGTRVALSDASIIEVCNDKWKSYLFLKARGFNVPKTYFTLPSVLKALDSGEVCYPIVVKPRFGCGSIGLNVVENEMGLLYFYRRNVKTIAESYLKYESAAAPIEEQILYQECLNGQEYGVDIINDLDGNPQTAIVKKKLAMRAGETDVAEIVDEPIIMAEAMKLAYATRHVANMDCDVFLVDDKPYILEMNARFGGGYPFSHMGGCDLPRAIVAWARGEKPAPETLKAKVGALGYKELFIVQSER